MTDLKLNVADGVSLPIELVTESNGILGKKGSGKTSAGIVLLEEMFAAGVPVVSIDPKGDHYGLRSSSDGKSEGLPIPVFGGRHADLPLEPTAGAYIADLVLARRLSCVLDVSEFSVSERRRFLTPFADRLYRAADREPMHLFLEECHEYIPQFVKGDDAAMVGVFERLVKNGRFKGIGVTLLSQRSASVNKNVLTQVDNLFVMRTVAAQDRAAVKGWISDNADSADILAQLPSLKNGETWLWQPARDEPSHFRFRMRRTFDAGHTPKVGEIRVQPTTLADVDLSAIEKAMAESIEKIKADDPRELKRQIVALEKRLRAKPKPEPVRPVEERIVEVPVEVSSLTDSDRQMLADQLEILQSIASEVGKAVDKILLISSPSPNSQSRFLKADRRPSAPSLHVVPKSPTPTAASGELRAGARRMVETLGRMHPLRLTKAQWGTVSKMKTTSGTWSTYLGDIRRMGLLDESPAGFTLTPAGFEYLGGQPDPMTPDELQNHYRGILRAGARRMLDTIMEWYPDAVGREELGDAVEMSTASGTFSTYLGDLTRNGLVSKTAGGYVATDILMRGALA